MTKVFLIESAAKSKKLKKILGSDWTVMASGGHIRSLSKSGDSALGFEVREGKVSLDFIPRDSRGQKTIASLRKAVKDAQEVVIATDLDREGELIGWHLKEVLGLKKCKRITYSEITEQAVRSALASPRDLDYSLIGSGLARACLDKLVGFKFSPLLWQYSQDAKSVGRVQSCVLHFLCDRDREIANFVPVTYFSLYCDYQEGWRAYYYGSGSSEQEAQEGSRIYQREQVDQILNVAKTENHILKNVDETEEKKNPPPPFTTSSLQQEAGSRLGFTVATTMKVAQKLYEGGYITYLRTDSVALSKEAVTAIRQWLQENNPDLIPESAVVFKSSKNSQEAHEAIRPTAIAASIVELSSEEQNLYRLIWYRTIASQCCPARLKKVVLISQSGSALWKANGQTVSFKGYLNYWSNVGKESILPQLAEGKLLTLEGCNFQKKQTSPPSLYTEPKLVKKMEKEGIGRPSTYSSVIDTLRKREYIEGKKKGLSVTSLGLEVDQFLQEVFPDLIEVSFTSEMENSLDKIALGESDWQSYFSDLYFSYFLPTLSKAEQTINSHGIGSRSSSTNELLEFPCPSCGEYTFYKVPSNSSKLSIPYYRKCHSCQYVQFWNAKAQQWQSPGKASQEKTTDYSCPACDKKLIQRSYIKKGVEKQLLACPSTCPNSKNHKKSVVFFSSKGKWWSPVYGELNL